MFYKQNISSYLYKVALGLFIYMPFHVFLSQWLSTYTGYLEFWKIFKDLLTFLLAGLLVLAVYVWRRSNRLFNYLFILISLYAVIHLIIGYFTHQPETTFVLALVYNLRIFAYLLIGYSLVLLLPTKKVLVYRFMKLLIIISTIVSLLAIIQRFLPSDFLTHFGYSINRGVKPNFFIDDKSDLPRVFSTLRDPNSLGVFLILPIIFLVSKLKQDYKTDKRNLLLGLIMLHFLALFLTFSRSSLLGVIVAFGCWFLLTNFKHIGNLITAKLLVIFVSIVVVIVGLVFINKDQYFVQNTVFHADETTKLEDPNSLRISLLKKTTKGIIDQPFGHGPGTAGLVSTRLPNGLLTENYYLQILYEVGVLGFLVFIAILYLVVQNLYKNRLHGRLNNVLLASLLGVGVTSLFFHTLSNEALSMSTFIIIGLALVCQKTVSKVPHKR